ncbi:MAG: hypothetical protein K1W21_03915 [Oscillospiraceae bacterium]|jgi:tetratricopeptide (TPR) repeat protein
MGTVRKSAKTTATLIVVAVAATLVYRWYSSSDADYFDMVKAFMQTKAMIGDAHVFFINAAFWVTVVASVVQAVLSEKYGFDMVSTSLGPLLAMCVLAVLFIPGIGFTNIHLFWLICYILMAIGLWLSARQAQKFCLGNSNFLAIMKDPKTKPELNVSRIDFAAAMLLTLVLYLFLALVVIGTLVFGIGNRELIAGEDDVTPVVSAIRYDAAVELMNDGQYESAMEEFRLLENYSDSKSRASKCEDMLYLPTYQEGNRLMEQGEYDEARSAFWRIYDYKDSAEKISQCDELQYGPQYDEAVALMSEGQYEDALEIFETLWTVGYKDLSQEVDQCRGSIKSTLAGTWQGDAGSCLELMDDLTCSYVDGGGATGTGTWDVIDTRITVDTGAFSYVIYGDLDNGYLTTSILFTADTSSWRDEVFTKE